MKEFTRLNSKSKDYNTVNKPDDGSKSTSGPVQRQYDSKRKRLNDPSLAVQKKDVIDDCKERFTNFDSALKVAGGFGKYQWLFMLIVQWSITQFSGNYVIMPLATYVPEVYCSVTSG